MTSVADLPATLKLLSDPTRLRLLALLSQDELAVQELVTITGLAQSRVSNHLALLRRAGLVRDRREGSWSFHSLAAPLAAGPLTPQLHAAVIEPYLAGAIGRADTQALERVREQRRERSRTTHDALAKRWTELGGDFRAQTLRAEVLAALAPSRWVVADLGCGTGFLTEVLARRFARVIAVDHSDGMLAEARQRIFGEHVEFRRGELDRLPLADGEVDAAFANLVWHHVADMDAAAREVLRVLRPGASAVVSDLLPHEAEWMRETMGDLRLGIEPGAVVAALARAGFTEIVTESVHDAQHVVAPDGSDFELPMFLVRGRRPQRRGEVSPSNSSNLIDS
ncbi:MAG: ArsR/SmtB family transcription factor [Planctomycetota bacterium]